MASTASFQVSSLKPSWIRREHGRNKSHYHTQDSFTSVACPQYSKSYKKLAFYIGSMIMSMGMLHRYSYQRCLGHFALTEVKAKSRYMLGDVIQNIIDPDIDTNDTERSSLEYNWINGVQWICLWAYHDCGHGDPYPQSKTLNQHSEAHHSTHHTHRHTLHAFLLVTEHTHRSQQCIFIQKQYPQTLTTMYVTSLCRAVPTTVVWQSEEPNLQKTQLYNIYTCIYWFCRGS